LAVDTLDTVGRVDVLDQCELVAGGTTLSGGDGAVGEEILPDLNKQVSRLDLSTAGEHCWTTYPVPTCTILANNLVLVGEPVTVPLPESSRVVHTNSVNALDFEASALERANEEVKRSRSIGTREDIFVHEQAPDEVLVLPGLTKTGDLKEEDTIIVEHVVDLVQELAEVTNTNVLGHFEAGNLVEATLRNGDVTVVHAENARLFLGNASVAKTTVTPGSLVAAKSDTSSVCAVVHRRELSESTPAAANIEHLLTRLEADLLTNNGKLVVLELLERLLGVDVGNDTRGVNHTRAKEPTVEVVTAVVVVTNLLLVLRTSVHNHFRHHSSKEEPEEREGKAEAGPIVAVFHNLKTVTVELDVSVKVHLVECLHRNPVPATVFEPVALVLEREIVLNRCTRVASLLVDTRR
jgi:hypothetical protein